MNTSRSVWLAVVATAIVQPVAAQESNADLEARAARDAAAAEAAARRAESEMLAGRRVDEVEMHLREAERRLAEAAQQVAELSISQLPRVERLERAIRAGSGPVLGVTIGAGIEKGPVEGVEVLGVSPGGAAEEAGLQAGDVIVSVNDESLTADSGMAANRKLLDFMEGIEEGDELDVQYLRDGNTARVSLKPRAMNRTFAFDFDAFPGPDVHVAPDVRRFNRFVWIGDDAGFGDLELVKLTERLGSYFGTSDGLLVVRAPGNDALKLEDGDVILSIGDRKPNSVSHAMRILGSYQAGEQLQIEIMRDKRKRRIDVTVPDSQSNLTAPLAPVPPVAPPAVAHPVRAIVIGRERT